MELIEYTNKWVLGEIYEDVSIVIAGIAFLILSILAWRFGTSESARGPRSLRWSSRESH